MLPNHLEESIMTRASFPPLIFLFAMTAASASVAGDIVKCVDSAGRVTLTDSPCPEGTQTLLATPAPAKPGVVMERIRVAALPPAVTPTAAPTVAHDSFKARRPANRMLARDVFTLRAARMSMDALDQTRNDLRSKLAGLN
jgi:hypothetical protein